MIIALCATRNYYPQLVQSIAMLRKTQPSLKHIYAFIEDDNFLDSYKDIATFINISTFAPAAYNSLNGRTRFTYVSLIRCYFAELLPQEDKILYLDLDVFITQDIKDLWETNIDGYAIAGVLDKGVGSKKLSYIAHPETYINSGVLLMNLKYFRTNNLVVKLHQLLHTWPLVYPDQDALNLICQDQILYLDPKWNSGDVTGYVDDVIIHHTTDVKPWNPSSMRFPDWVRTYLAEGAPLSLYD